MVPGPQTLPQQALLRHDPKALREQQRPQKTPAQSKHGGDVNRKKNKSKQKTRISTDTIPKIGGSITLPATMSPFSLLLAADLSVLHI